jgi:2-polyprenyl-6-methoxyphenol hydroxylase-like FAD-dependent oxidoreductase
VICGRPIKSGPVPFAPGIPLCVKRWPAPPSRTTLLRGVKDIVVTWRPRLIVGADGRTSTVRCQLGFTLLHDEPHNLIGGMLIDGVPEWPQDV